MNFRHIFQVQRQEAVGHHKSEVSSMWNMVTNGLQSFTESTNFEYIEHPQNLKIRIDRIDLESVLTNLLANSLESMKNAKIKNSTVRCDVTYLKSGLAIKFSDNGTRDSFEGCR